MSNRKIDENGYMTFENVLISREGVFDYSGEQIAGPDGDLDPNAVYKVYRPKSAVCSKEFIESLERKPLIDDHTMLGKDGVPAEKKGTHGVLTDVTAVGNELYGTITVWSESMKKKIRDGKRELSLGYTGRFRRSSGMFEGQRYDFVQYDLSANHIALVDEARMGHSCRIMDHAVFISDSLSLPDKSTTELSDMEENKNDKSCCDEIIEKLKGCSDEDVAKVKDYLKGLEEKKPGDDGDDENKDDPEKKGEPEKKDGEDADDKGNPEKKDDPEKKENKDSDQVLGDEGNKDGNPENKDDEGNKETCDKKKVADAAIKEYKKMVELANSKEFVSCFGNVSLDGVNTQQELAQKVCMMDSALKFVSPDKALDALKGRLAKVGKDGNGERTTITDSRESQSAFDFAQAFQSRK